MVRLSELLSSEVFAMGNFDDQSQTMSQVAIDQFNQFSTTNFGNQHEAMPLATVDQFDQFSIVNFGVQNETLPLVTEEQFDQFSTTYFSYQNEVIPLVAMDQFGELADVSRTGRGVKLPLKKQGDNYLVTVGFGTPKLDLTLMVDTGSATTWIKCKPCITCNPNETLFDPRQSSTFSNCSSANNCHQSQDYHDKSKVDGNSVQDTLTLTSQVFFPRFEFLCGHKPSGFDKVEGLLALGLADNSFIHQTSQAFSQKFGYCLPSSDSSTGFLAFGDEAAAACKPRFHGSLVLGPNGDNHNYYINLFAITIGQKTLQMPSNGSSSYSQKALLDTGTTVSRLPPSVYSKLNSSFWELMSEYPIAEPHGIMKTCFNLERHDLSTANIPNITLHFGDSLDLTLGSPSVVFSYPNSIVCLAFAEDEKTIIGSHHLENVNILYDIANKQVGLSLNPGCSSY
ncbi:aspartyl protease family protein At5g10770-like [Mangifera indica]|uniref:aspartyl protease family protein At5g10770-like n=1 Tax=Mangifera indica TaxID=29780 RepID=UPI001CFA8E34|nr:aspartyl protease family protein At5g10770-like [Mangifera indica]